MKISMVTPWSIVCGNALYSQGLVPALQKKASVRVVEIRHPLGRNPLDFYRVARNASQDDLIHVQFDYGLFGDVIFTGVFAPLFFLACGRLPIVTSIHGVDDSSTHGIVGMLRSSVRKVINKTMFSRSTILHVHTEDAEQALLRIGAPKEKIRVSPLGVFTTPKKMNKSACKKKLGLGTSPVILLLGFVHGNKGHDIVIDALPRLPGVRVLIAGESKSAAYEQSLRDQAQRLGVMDRVIFHGAYNEEDMPTILNAADVVVLPYRVVTQSDSLNKFLAYDIPAVTSDHPFFVRLNERYDCLLTFRTQDELVSQIKNALKNSKGARLARKRFVEDRKPEKIVNDILAMYGDAFKAMR